MPHPALISGSVAVVTGGASGIGLAAATRFAEAGMRVCIADLGGDALWNAVDRVETAAPGAEVFGVATDVSVRAELERLEAAVRDRYGAVDVLMNNAGIQPGSAMYGPAENWERILGVNLWGVIHGSQVFAPGMVAQQRPGLIINTGSKQGITTPPGDPAYNVSKAGREGVHRGAGARIAQHAGRAGERASADPRLRLHRPHRARAARRSLTLRGRRSRRSISCWASSRRAAPWDGAPVPVVVRIEDERAKGRILPAAGRRHPRHDFFEEFRNAGAFLGGDARGSPPAGRRSGR